MGHHFFVAPGDVHDGVVELSGAQAHHAARALRVRTGEPISVADGTGRVLDAIVLEVGDVVRAVVRTVRTPEHPKPAITLYQAVAKGDRMYTLVEKAVEVGIERIVPFIAERSVVRWDERKRSKAMKRWTEIGKAAAKQCRSALLTTVDEVREHLGVLGEAGPVLALDGSSATRLRDALPPSPPDELVLVVGPEGGLTAAELGSLSDEGASVVTLGERVLRTETAGLVAATIVGYAYGSIG